MEAGAAASVFTVGVVVFVVVELGWGEDLDCWCGLAFPDHNATGKGTVTLGLGGAEGTDLGVEKGDAFWFDRAGATAEGGGVHRLRVRMKASARWAAVANHPQFPTTGIRQLVS